MTIYFICYIDFLPGGGGAYIELSPLLINNLFIFLFIYSEIVLICQWLCQLCLLERLGPDMRRFCSLIQNILKERVDLLSCC